MTCDSLQQLAVWDCPNLQSLPLSVHITTDGDGERRASTPPLKGIRGGKEWWDEGEWEPKSLFQPLFEPIPKLGVDEAVSIIFYIKINFFYFI